MPDIDRNADRGKIRALRIVLWAIVLLAIGLWLGLSYADKTSDAPENKATAFAEAFGGPFALTAPDGSTVTDRTLAGKPYAIFFGFTRCPDVCPTNLARMARLRSQLKGDGNKFAIVFASVDPEQDTPQIIGDYVKLFGTPIIGLTGTEDQLATIKKGYGVFSEKVPTEGGDYTVDHTATTYLMTADGKFAGTIDHHEADTVALEKLKRLVG